MKDIRLVIKDMKMLQSEREDLECSIQASIQALEFVNKLLDDWDKICNSDNPLIVEAQLNKMTTDSVSKLAGDYFAWKITQSDRKA